MDDHRLRSALADEFGGTEAERRVVARQARDLADSGKAERDRDQGLSVPGVVEHLSDAPDDATIVERWNWWMGALETAYGGYERFTVRYVEDGPEVNA